MGELIIPEQDILKSCLSRLKTWEIKGVVIHADRYNAGNIHQGRFHMRMARSGTPDITAYVKYNGICAICFFECKSSIGKQSIKQIEFMMKFRDLSNVYYDLITHPNQVDVRIESITGYTQRILDSI
jgi:hypothetical protein